MRYLRLTDLFEIKCKKCGSNEIDISSYECIQCGNIITTNCNKCGNHYDYHDFIQLNEETGQFYDNKGKELKNENK